MACFTSWIPLLRQMRARWNKPRGFAWRRGLSLAVIVATCAPHVGCVFIPVDSLEQDRRIHAQKDRYVWTVPGQRRLAASMVLGYYTLDRDEFHLISSDEERYVAAIASQRYQETEYLYLIDGSSGDVLFAGCLPGRVQWRHHFSLNPEYLGVVAVTTSVPRRYVLQIRKVPDGVILLEGELSKWLQLEGGTLKHIDLLIVSDTARVCMVERLPSCADREVEVFIDISSGRRLPLEEVEARLGVQANHGLPCSDHPWTYEAVIEAVSTTPDPHIVKCGDLRVEIERCRTWLVAVQESNSN